jgi:hypothetical protein
MQHQHTGRQMLRDSADKSAQTGVMLGHFGEQTCKWGACHGKRSDAQQSRSKEAEAEQKVTAHHLAFGRAAHQGSAGFVGPAEKVVSRR